MAKKIKFPLKLKGDFPVRSLDELKSHFDFDKITGYFLDGKLLTWLEDRNYTSEANAIRALRRNDTDLHRKLAGIFGVEYSRVDSNVDITAIEQRNKKILDQVKEVTHVDDEISHSNVTEITANNYTNILKAVHDNIDSYLGKKIKFSGYVYRVLDFSENQFVLARDMILNSQSYVVGFLSEYDKIKDFEDSSWVEIIGTISQGKYHNRNIPIIKVESINKIEKPEDATVLPPSDTYIPTSAIL